MTTTPTPADVDRAIADTVTSPPSVRQAIDYAVQREKAAGNLPYFSMPTGKHKTKRVRPGVLEITIPMNTGVELTIELNAEGEPS
jgi:hypothetical protein